MFKNVLCIAAEIIIIIIIIIKKTDRILSGEKCVYLARKTSALGGTN